MKESLNLGECLQCFEVYCKNCSDAEDSETFCSVECEQEYVPTPDIEEYDIQKDLEMLDDSLKETT